MTAKPAPVEDGRANGLRWVDATHMQLARFAEVFFEHQGAIPAALTERFKEKSQVGWSAIFDGTDACMAAVVKLTEAPDHPHLATRGTFIERDGIGQTASAPRFSRTTATPSMARVGQGARTREAFTSWSIEDVEAPIDSGVEVEG